MKILIVDDSVEKIGVIFKTLCEIKGISSGDIQYAVELNKARSLLREEFFDLLVLDLNMPPSLGEAPSLETGVNFVDEIMETIKIRKPIDILALTAFDESAAAFREKVGNRGFLLLSYKEDSQDWKNVLKAKAEYLLLCHMQRESVPRLPRCDAAFITAVPIESKAVMALDLPWEDMPVAGDPSRYHCTRTPSGKQLIHVQQSEMGMPAAAALTAKLILHFAPRYILMPGIAAGLDPDMKPGDIIVGTDIWNYGNGKYIEQKLPDGSFETIFSPDPQHLNMPKPLMEKLSDGDYTAVLEEIGKNAPVQKIGNRPSLRFGTIACGTAVVASREVVEEQIKSHARKTIGLDMESYGVCYSSQITADPNVAAIIVKAVSDGANIKKNDTAQPYAAYTSATFALHLVENVLLKEES